MSLRSPTASPGLSDGEVLSGDEEKAISTQAKSTRDTTVNTSTRPNGSSSRASRFLGLSTNDSYHYRDDNGNVGLPEDHRERVSEECETRGRSRSPYRRERTRSRSPYRAGKEASGEKRKRHDDHKLGPDPRRFKVHYEDKQISRGGAGNRANILDRAGRPKANPLEDGWAGKSRAKSDRGRERDRSRSPFRHARDQNLSSRDIEVYDNRGRALLHNRGSMMSQQVIERRGNTPPVTERESPPPIPHSVDSAETKILLPQRAQASDKIQDQQSMSQAQSQVMSAGDAEEQPPQLSEAEIIEQRRKRREAIKARHKSQPGLLVQALQHNIASAPATPVHESSGTPSEQQSPPSSLGSPSTPHRESPPISPAAFAVADDEELANRQQDGETVDEDEGPSAADYDPNMDMQEDRPDHRKQTTSEPTINATKQDPVPAVNAVKEFDMFADDGDDDDMFAPTDNTVKVAPNTKSAKTLDQSLLDNWDYPDGHYRIILGELLDNRYAVQQQIGKGTFATVVKAKDEKTGQPVAIKIAANNETMYKAGQKEMDFLKILNDSDPDDKKHVIRLLRSFDHKGHMCIVFEALSADLREVLKKFGRNVGLNLKAIRSYAQQMFLSLSHMKKCQILHADLKPDNILVSERRNLLKVCDLGTAAFVADTELTPYLVSRFYRAPEVILGMPFDYAIDMWSIGCTLFELYTGRILFAGADNNQMLRVIQECRGKIPVRMLKQSHPDQRDRHFDLENNFFSQERDKITGKATLRQINFKSGGEPGKDIKTRLSHNAKGLQSAELKEHLAFVDLLDKCLQLDPARRITPNDALRHGFVAHSTQPAPTTQKVVPAMIMSRAR